jgi:crossover junction endodeoxyribonuclease RuvC
MRVLGIDPGLTRCGVAVIDGLPGRPVTAHFVGVITTAADGELADRLTVLHAELTGLIDKYSPEVIAIERVFSQQNVRSAMSTAQAAGVGLLLAGQRGLRVGMHTPTEVKAAVTGNGRADKKQVTLMVTKIAQLKAVPKPADAADALAIAITQAWRGSVAAKYEAAKKAMSK